MRILLVEGNQDDVRLLEGEAVEADGNPPPSGRTTFRALSVDALAEVLRVGPDVAVIAGDNLELLSRLTTLAPELPVIMMVTTWDQAIANQAIGRGAQDVIARDDIDPAALSRALELAIRRKKASRLEIEDATRSRDEVIAIISHDLRNPLNVLTMTMALLGEDRALTEQKRDSHMKKLDRATMRMVALVDELLDITRLDANRLVIDPELQPAPLLVAEALLASNLTTSLTTADKVLRIEQTVPPQVMVYGDPPRVVQVLTVLLSQAVSMAPEGGLIEIAVEATDSGARFTVRVSGVMLPLADAARAYERFWSKTHGAREGTGLGLPIAKGLVDAHGGEISASSDHLGTTFSFTLPSKKTEVA